MGVPTPVIPIVPHWNARRDRVRFRNFLATLIVCVAPLTLHAESDVNASGSDSGFSVAGGIGFTGSPSTFLMQFDGLYHFDRNLAAGPSLQIGVDGQITIVSMSADGRYTFQLAGPEDPASKLEPFVTGGLGFTHYSVDAGASRDFSETGFLMMLGFGLGYSFSDKLGVESSMRFNIVPTEVLGDKFYYSWQLAGIRYRF
jgi:hypothetical protein